jgi:hypothetical protein
MNSSTSVMQIVPPGINRWEHALLVLALVVVTGSTLIYADKYGVEEKVQTILDWQVSAFSGLTGVDQSIYN